MALVINTNLASLAAQRHMNVSSNDMSQSMERLASGKRINSAADDSAGLGVSNSLNARITSLGQANRNANDAISLVNLAEGALDQVTSMLVRMRELAVQAVNGTYGAGDRDNMNLEFGALQAEITRVAGSTYFNGIDVISASNELTFQVGFESTDTMTLTTQTMTATALSVDAGSEDVDTAAGATSALSAIDTAITTVDAYRGDLGSKANRLAYSSANLESRIENQSAARSRIMDADYAAESANLARTQVLQQAGAAMLAQANASTSTVLSLLK